jgi:hypothetical protein
VKIDFTLTSDGFKWRAKEPMSTTQACRTLSYLPELPAFSRKASIVPINSFKQTEKEQKKSDKYIELISIHFSNLVHALEQFRPQLPT